MIVEHQEERLRVEALGKAVEARRTQEDPAITVQRAEAFYAFLQRTGDDESEAADG